MSHARQLAHTLVASVTAAMVAGASFTAASAAPPAPAQVPSKDLPSACSQPIPNGPVTCLFKYAGWNEQTFVVPDGITSIDVVAIGADGGLNSDTSRRPLGAEVSATIDTTPGQTLYLKVGGQGGDVSAGSFTAGAGGYNGGAPGGEGLSPALPGAAGGGGATDIRTLPSRDENSNASRLVVAAGAGGGSPQTHGIGGDAGQPGAAGATTFTGGGGGAGTTTAGGAGGTGSFEGTRFQRGVSGSAWAGGPGAGAYWAGGGSYLAAGGGGGGGLYGGGGGASFGGGGGGSSYAPGGQISAKSAPSEASIELEYVPPRGIDCSQAEPLGPVDCEFGYTGREQAFSVPDGVTSMTVEAIGADGGNHLAGTTRPVGAVATADIDVNPGETLYIEVGGQGGDVIDGVTNGRRGGFNGGADGGDGASPNLNGAAGGGGATDIRTTPRGTDGTLQSRLVIAAGAGGGSAFGDGKGGNAGQQGRSILATALGGEPGGDTAGGHGGTTTDAHARAGADGVLGYGGAGAAGYRYLPTTNIFGGGGGGGGLYGGGGGSTPSGGGGGSSYAPGGTVTLKPAPAAASLHLTFQPAGPAASLELVDPTVLEGHVGVPYRDFTVHATSVNGGWVYADVTDDVRMQTVPGGPFCPAEGCTFSTPGQHTVILSLDNASLSFDLTVLDEPRLVAAKGNRQTAAVGTWFHQRLKAQLLDELGTPVAGTKVKFRVKSGPAHFRIGDRRALVTTGTTGIAKSPRLIAGSKPGKVIVTAVAQPGGPHVTFQVRVTKAAP